MTAPNPAAFTFAPDGRIVYGDRPTAEIHLASADRSSDHARVGHHGVATTGDGRLVGVAVHPAFPATSNIYAWPPPAW